MPQDISALLDRYRMPANKSRERWLRNEYGIDTATYEALLRSQGLVCAICHQSETAIGENGKAESLCVDHDHATGRIRGLLCHDCNRALGLFDDDAARLRAASTYLEHGGTAGQQHQPRRR